MGKPEQEAVPSPPDGTTEEHREYRAAELAREAGITERTLRFYRERKLLPPPRREGRIAWYDEHHLARLRTISTLLARGHTLGGIADLMDAFEQGRTSSSTAALLGMDSQLTRTFSDETPVSLTPEDLADRFGSDVTAEDLAEALDIGYLSVDGDEIVHVSRRLLDASAALVHDGIPLSAVLGAGRHLREHVDAIAEVFAQMLRRYVLPGDLSTADAEHVAATLRRLSTVAKQVVDAELGLALDRRVGEEAAAWFGDSATGGGTGRD
ncbi:MerR family transcriptional regulator [Streptomyces sp. TR06-5]|uniref:MerR family transcriptional regulator n=1 Tax=Streptomyces sp. TR06-5 TaxID=3385976 RepID=UPI0039A12D40